MNLILRGIYTTTNNTIFIVTNLTYLYVSRFEMPRNNLTTNKSIPKFIDDLGEEKGKFLADHFQKIDIDTFENMIDGYLGEFEKTDGNWFRFFGYFWRIQWRNRK